MATQTTVRLILNTGCDCHPGVDSSRFCPYCHQEDPEPETHMARVHDADPR